MKFLNSLVTNSIFVTTTAVKMIFISKVMKIVRAIRNGWIKPKKSKDDKPRYFLLWDSNEDPVSTP